MEPNWKPLESKLGPDQCVGFMFMGRWNGVNQYKHGISRRYLLLDDEGRAFQDQSGGTLREVPFEEALAQVEAPLRDLGETLRTAYDEAYIERKGKALAAAGIGLVRIRVAPEDEAG